MVRAAEAERPVPVRRTRSVAVALGAAGRLPRFEPAAVADARQRGHALGAHARGAGRGAQKQRVGAGANHHRRTECTARPCSWRARRTRPRRSTNAARTRMHGLPVAGPDFCRGAHTRTHAHTHTRTHARAHARTRSQMQERVCGVWGRCVLVGGGVVRWRVPAGPARPPCPLIELCPLVRWSSHKLMKTPRQTARNSCSTRNTTVAGVLARHVAE